MTRSSHEALAEAVAITGDCTLVEARAILSHVYAALTTVTPEMAEAFFSENARAKTIFASIDNLWRAMLAVSPLAPEKERADG